MKIIRRKHKLILILFILITVYFVVLIIHESTVLQQSPLSILQYRLSKLVSVDDKKIKELYFNKQPDKESLDSVVIRNLLKAESDKVKEANSLSNALYFEQLKKKFTKPIKFELVDDVDSTTNEEGEDKVYDFKKFIDQFIDVLIDNKLAFPHAERTITNDGKPVIWETKFAEQPYDILSLTNLNEFMDFDDDFVLDLKLKHKLIVKSLPTERPNFYKNNGYVIVGGGIYTWYSFLSIQSLRQTGSVLPVELILPKKSDYDKNLCENILPKYYNTKCITFDKIYSKKILKKVGELKGYQIKSFALLASTFENILYLDSDNLPIRNPDNLFESDIFQKFGLISWPDFWRRTASPNIYSIMDIRVTGKPIRHVNDFFTPIGIYTNKKDLISVDEKINFHDRNGTVPDWTTESGQLLINKKTHFNVLLLSLYYNFDGPTGYHPLLSQGGAGEGDKETIIFASHYLKKTYYQVFTKPEKIFGSFIKLNNWFVDSTIAQVNPIGDFQNLKKMVKFSIEKLSDMGKSYIYSYDYTFGKFACMGGMNGKDEEFFDRPDDLFYHVHNPKLDPWKYVGEDLFTDLEEKPIRNFGEIFDRIGFDFELKIWENIIENLCGNDEIPSMFKELNIFKGKNFKKICDNDKVTKRLEWLRKTGEEKLKNYKVDHAKDNKNNFITLTEEEDKFYGDLIYDKMLENLSFGYIDDDL